VAYARYTGSVDIDATATLYAQNLVTLNAGYQTLTPMVSLSASYCGGTATIRQFDYYTWPYTLPPDISGESWPAAAQAAFTAWLPNLPSPGDVSCMALAYIYRARLAIGTSTADAYLCTGAAETIHPGETPAKHFDLVAPAGWDLAVTWALRNAFCKGQTTNTTHQNRQSPRRWTDRTLSVRLYADDQTELTVSAGGATVTEALGTAETHAVLGANAGTITTSISLTDVPLTDTSYGNVHDVSVSSGGVSFTHREFDDYSADGETWTRDNAGAHFHASVSAGGVHDLQRVAADTGTVSHGVTTSMTGPIRYRITAGRYGPDNGYGHIT
jgi:hypothetical protein